MIAIDLLDFNYVTVTTHDHEVVTFVDPDDHVVLHISNLVAVDRLILDDRGEGGFSILLDHFDLRHPLGRGLEEARGVPVKTDATTEREHEDGKAEDAGEAARTCSER